MEDNIIIKMDGKVQNIEANKKINIYIIIMICLLEKQFILIESNNIILKMEENLKFIAGEFLKNGLSDDKKYLYYYFKTKIQKKFVVYYEFFHNKRWFQEHTGVICDIKQLILLERRYKKIEKSLTLAKEKFDSRTIALIRSGKFKL